MLHLTLIELNKMFFDDLDGRNKLSTLWLLALLNSQKVLRICKGYAGDSGSFSELYWLLSAEA